ncbi:hypothetical protein CYMTET_31343 [Cymbomonas tetramitiformis]|uniref:Uncharacterized protein n=1 Tax=Cymbomonas tetramitiformis TaxID=36881 RepID=A0AAE0FI40_9CHLO|nr:hypothetical protein CYMTET_31343 [Cymbomonas tetramitiformis]
MALQIISTCRLASTPQNHVSFGKCREHRVFTPANKTLYASYRRLSLAQGNVAKRSPAIVARAGENPFVEGWLDMTKMFTGNTDSSSSTNELAEKIGSEIYADVGGWHLFLREMKLANFIANEVTTRVSDGDRVEDAVIWVCSRVPVKLGQKKDVPLIDLLSNIAIQDMVKIIEDYAADDW